MMNIRKEPRTLKTLSFAGKVDRKAGSPDQCIEHGIALELGVESDGLNTQPSRGASSAAGRK